MPPSLIVSDNFSFGAPLPLPLSSSHNMSSFSGAKTYETAGRKILAFLSSTRTNTSKGNKVNEKHIRSIHRGEHGAEMSDNRQREETHTDVECYDVITKSCSSTLPKKREKKILKLLSP